MSQHFPTRYQPGQVCSWLRSRSELETRVNC